MTVSWSGVDGAASYNVYRIAGKVNALSVTSTTYSWTVKAVDGNNQESAASTAAAGTTTGTPPPPAAVCYTVSSYAHITAGRANVLGGYTYANGSAQYLGLWNIYTTTTLEQTGAIYYVIGTCP